MPGRTRLSVAETRAGLRVEFCVAEIPGGGRSPINTAADQEALARNPRHARPEHREGRGVTRRRRPPATKWEPPDFRPVGGGEERRLRRRDEEGPCPPKNTATGTRAASVHPHPGCRPPPKLRHGRCRKSLPRSGSLWLGIRCLNGLPMCRSGWSSRSRGFCG